MLPVVAGVLRIVNDSSYVSPATSGTSWVMAAEYAPLPAGTSMQPRPSTTDGAG